MKLTELQPVFLGAGGEGISNADGSPVPERFGVGVEFDCPCGCASPCYVPFANPLDGGPRLQAEPHPIWQRIGDTFETLQLSPSILRMKEKGGCGWHGYIGLTTPGEVTSC